MRARFSSRIKMFFRIALRSLLVRRGGTFITVLAVSVAAAASTALLNLYTDINAKVSNEFRRFGSNVVASTVDGKPFTQAQIDSLTRAIGPQDLAVPFSYLVAHGASGTPVVIAATDLARVQALTPGWKVAQSHSCTANALVGSKAASTLSKADRASFVLEGAKAPLDLSCAATVQTALWKTLAQDQERHPH